MGIMVALGVGAWWYQKRENRNVKKDIKKPTSKPIEKQPYQALGLRNNNPMNIVYNPANRWVGQTGRNGRFSTFESADYGLRAGAILLRNYMKKYSLRSVQGLINRFAPSHENPTNQYAQYVARQVGVSVTDNSLTEDDIPNLIMAIVQFENGDNPFSLSHVQGVVERALA